MSKMHPVIARIYKLCQLDPIYNIIIKRSRSRLYYNKKEYPFIPSYKGVVNDVVRSLDFTDNVESLKFIDIGCGYPIIPMIFEALGYEAYGLEYEDFNVEAVKGEQYPEVIKGNLLEYSFNEYDILYSYNPIRDTETMLAGLRNIISSMKVGAKFYFANANLLEDELENLGFKVIKYPVYLYKKN